MVMVMVMEAIEMEMAIVLVMAMAMVIARLVDGDGDDNCVGDGDGDGTKHPTMNGTCAGGKVCPRMCFLYICIEFHRQIRKVLSIRYKVGRAALSPSRTYRSGFVIILHQTR